MEGGLPFEMKQPRFNRETEEAISEARDMASGKIEATSQSVDNFFQEMGL